MSERAVRLVTVNLPRPVGVVTRFHVRGKPSRVALREELERSDRKAQGLELKNAASFEGSKAQVTKEKQ
jgi:hypothetical protein